MSFYHAIHATRLVQMPSKKKKRSCQFSSATARRRKLKKSFSSDWAENLAEIKGSYFSTSTISALDDKKFPKIMVDEPLEDLESELKHGKSSSRRRPTNP